MDQGNKFVSMLCQDLQDDRLMGQKRWTLQYLKMESDSDFKDFQGWGNWNQNWINIFWVGIGIRIELNIVWLEWELNWNNLLPELDMTDLGENINMIFILHVFIIMNYQYAYYHWSLSLSPLFFCNFVTFDIWQSSTKSHSIHLQENT